MTDIGSIIKEYLRQNGSSINQLAKQMKMSATQLYSHLKHNHITIERLDQISRTLNHDFFVYLSGNNGPSEEEVVKLRTEIKEINSKVAMLQKEVTYLQEINALLKTKQG
jgi:transcriptional regulator with XRE-family HTH domain